MSSIKKREFLLAVHLICNIYIYLRGVQHYLGHNFQQCFINILLLYISILLKERNLDREEDITTNLEVTVQGGYIMGRDSKIEPFGFEMDVLGSTRRPTIVNKLVVVV